jgi:hypothetical protein
LQLLLPPLGATLEDAVGGDAESIGDSEELAELVEQRQSKTGIATQFDLYPSGCGKTRFEASTAPRNSLVSTTQPDKKKVCVDKTSSSWMYSAM